MSAENTSKYELEKKLLAWLTGEGYPLEFFTAHSFRQSGLRVIQSDFVTDSSGKVREIDVAASLDFNVNDSILRIIHVVECKWSKDKPWLLFKDETTVRSSALVTQMIANSAGSAVAWLQAGNGSLKNLSIFTGDGFTFSGRQAFSKDADRFYQSAQSVISNCVSMATSYNQPLQSSRVFPITAICIPVIVLDGDLFEVLYDEEGEELKLEAKVHCRLRWKGNSEYRFNSVIDVVTKPHLKEFLNSRIDEIRKIGSAFRGSIIELTAMFEGTLQGEITVTPGPRGVLGKPQFITELTEFAKRRRS